MNTPTQTGKPATTNPKQQAVTYLIVGQGLAGSLLAWELHRNGISFATVDEGMAITSSRIAAGMINPVNPKRFTVPANAEQLISDALEVYRSMEEDLCISIIHLQNIYIVFGNVKESNDLTLKSDHPFFQRYTNTEPVTEAHVIQPYGAFEVGLSGWIDVKQMLDSLRKFIATTYELVEETFDYNQLKQVDGSWSYKHITAKHVVFCEGHKASANPFFPDLHIIPCKGDVVEFTAPGFDPTRVIKKGIYIVPLGNHTFKAGSSYKWENGDEQLHQEDKAELVQKITELIDVPFSVTAHYTAIRPTTKTKETVVRTHAGYPTMHAINGLGTKGVTNGVKCVKTFIAAQKELL